ncbi:MAG: pyridoxamine 5'-phosphate oxidase family protein [Flavobacteriaceae bacterium]|nr:pyridoxamine 5'-phosphate oxidase family protein [Flavobacteriaceae bacterium]
MTLSKEITKSIENSVLCWLATVSKDNIPNVSPKEVFTDFGNEHIIIANIASPQTVKNIGENPNVCISFVDILVQKGFQLKGIAEIIYSKHPNYDKYKARLTEITEGKFPFSTITKIKILHSKPIIAPRYILYPETTEEEQIDSARKIYGLTTKSFF